MAKQWGLLTGLALIMVISSAGIAVAAGSGCSDTDYWNGTCTVSVDMDDEEVTIGVDVTVPGSPGSSGGGSGGGEHTGGSDNTVCDGVGGELVCRDTYDAIGPVTLSDIAHFRPSPGRNLMEPDGWMIVGLHTNFYAHANQHVVTGELRGETAWVRFTPIGYQWWYGDGSTHYSGTPGNTWRILGVTEFDRTPNSHIYRAPGTYYIDLSIVYRAEYRYAGESYIPIPGTLTLAANRLVAVAGDATTVLVEHDCTLNPTGPGC